MASWRTDTPNSRADPSTSPPFFTPWGCPRLNCWHRRQSAWSCWEALRCCLDFSSHWPACPWLSFCWWRSSRCIFPTASAPSSCCPWMRPAPISGSPGMRPISCNLRLLPHWHSEGRGGCPWTGWSSVPSGANRRQASDKIIKSPPFRVVTQRARSTCNNPSVPPMIPRYARDRMVSIWSPESKFRIWFEIEAHATDALAELGVVPKEAAKKIWEKGRDAKFDVARIDEIEREVKHDVIAFLTHLSEIVGPEARFVHQGMTSSDVLDTCL